MSLEKCRKELHDKDAHHIDEIQSLKHELASKMQNEAKDKDAASIDVSTNARLLLSLMYFTFRWSFGHFISF